MCKNHGTRQRNQCLPCAKAKAHGKHLNFAVCHVYRHTAKAAATSLPRFSAFFCRGSALAHGKGFAVCPINGTRQTTPLPTSECRVLFAVCGTRQSLCRVHIGLCRVLWHTAKQQSPVVTKWLGLGCLARLSWSRVHSNSFTAGESFGAWRFADSAFCLGLPVRSIEMDGVF